MSKLIDTSEYQADYDLGDYVSFLHEGVRLYGEIARVYNTRDLYHVEVLGQRYLVDRNCDAIRRENR